MPSTASPSKLRLRREPSARSFFTAGPIFFGVVSRTKLPTSIRNTRNAASVITVGETGESVPPTLAGAASHVGRKPMSRLVSLRRFLARVFGSSGLITPSTNWTVKSSPPSSESTCESNLPERSSGNCAERSTQWRAFAIESLATCAKSTSFFIVSMYSSPSSVSRKFCRGAAVGTRETIVKSTVQPPRYLPGYVMSRKGRGRITSRSRDGKVSLHRNDFG